MMLMSWVSTIATSIASTTSCKLAALIDRNVYWISKNYDICHQFPLEALCVPVVVLDHNYLQTKRVRRGICEQKPLVALWTSTNFLCLIVASGILRLTFLIFYLLKKRSATWITWLPARVRSGLVYPFRKKVASCRRSFWKEMTIVMRPKCCVLLADEFKSGMVWKFGFLFRNANLEYLLGFQSNWLNIASARRLNYSVLTLMLFSIKSYITPLSIPYCFGIYSVSFQ